MWVNPSFSGWPSPGSVMPKLQIFQFRVLIPLLVDDPLRAKKIKIEVALNARLNPSFSGWPSPGEGESFEGKKMVGLNPSFSGWPSPGLYLIYYGGCASSLNPSFSGWPSPGSYFNSWEYQELCLNPSFSGWPSPGPKASLLKEKRWSRLNPSFSGWPSPGSPFQLAQQTGGFVLIPLLVDDPLRVASDS